MIARLVRFMSDLAVETARGCVCGPVELPMKTFPVDPKLNSAAALHASYVASTALDIPIPRTLVPKVFYNYIKSHYPNFSLKRSKDDVCELCTGVGMVYATNEKQPLPVTIGNVPKSP